MKSQASAFTLYQKVAIALLALTQFTVILDFMVMSPMGDLLIKSININTTQFGFAVSVYAFSAGLSGLLTAGFADRFDRKRLLLFFYSGFITGTLFCGLATSYPTLIAARIITGLFGGVIGSISLAIVADLFSLQQRGRAMAFMQMGYGASQVLGIPISLYLANAWGWHAPFLLVVGLAIIIMTVIVIKLKPVTAHLKFQKDRAAFVHLWQTFSNKQYRIGFYATALLTVGAFMMMPFSSVFAVNNLNVAQAKLPLLFMCSGLGALVFMPLLGKWSDQFDKFRLFVIATVYMMTIVVGYTHLTPISFGWIIALNVLMMAGILGRSVPATALVTAISKVQDRGAFMSINASLQQIAGGAAAAVAGLIVSQKTKNSPIVHYDTLGWIMVAISLVVIVMLYKVNDIIETRQSNIRKEKGKVFTPESEVVELV
jgi:predicted MFS family arabinose efflux permease